jgi:hypothetical protein
VYKRIGGLTTTQDGFGNEHFTNESQRELPANDQRLAIAETQLADTKAKSNTI